MQKRRFLCFVLCLILVFSQAISITAQTESTTKIKNIIYMIPDGGGMAPFFLADKVKQNGGFSKEVYPDLTEVETGEMYIKQYLVGAETTHSASSSVTDSAPLVVCASLIALGVMANNTNPLVFENQLFMEYWILDNYENPDKNSKIKLYLPESNIYEISLDKPFVKSEIYGYLILGSLENVVKIRYWNCDLELTEDVIENQKACITEKTVEINSKKNFLDFENLNDEYFRNIKKYIKIDDKIYTCVEGRGTKIRNVEKIDLKKEFPNLRFFEKKRDSFLVLDSPYLFFLEKTEKDLQ